MSKQVLFESLVVPVVLIELLVQLSLNVLINERVVLEALLDMFEQNQNV